MAGNAKYLFIASMDVDADKEALFNEVYDTEHIPALLKVPGVLSVYRGSPSATMVFFSPPRNMVSGSRTPRRTDSTPGTLSSAGMCSWS